MLPVTRFIQLKLRYGGIMCLDLISISDSSTDEAGSQGIHSVPFHWWWIRDVHGPNSMWYVWTFHVILSKHLYSDVVIILYSKCVIETNTVLLLDTWHRWWWFTWHTELNSEFYSNNTSNFLNITKKMIILDIPDPNW